MRSLRTRPKKKCLLLEDTVWCGVQVATRSANSQRQVNAQSVLDEITTHSGTLVEHTKEVSGELIRIAILWHEQVCPLRCCITPFK